MHRHIPFRPIQRVVGAILLLCALSTVQAATYTVNTAIDPPSGSSTRCAAGNANTCSLRDAVSAINGTLTGNALVVFAPAVTQINLSQPITLNTWAGTVTEHVIDGGGRVVIDGGGSARLFTTQIPSGGTTGAGTIRLVGLTLRNGQADRGAVLYRPQSGGGVLSGDNRIIFDRCRMENNHATDNGGAIYAGGAGVLLIGTTLSGNSAVNGGGAVWAWARTEIRSSTFVDNSAGSGGAIYSNTGGTLLITNSTISGNLATQTNSGGGIFSNESRLDFANVTLSGNTGFSLVQFGSFDISNPPPPSTIRNTYVDNCILLFTTDISGSNNLTFEANCQAQGMAWLNVGNPQLGLLGDHGGPTPTLLPGAGSAAIDAGDDAVCAESTRVDNRDQRGAQRPVGAHCDIGAVEAGASFVLNVTAVGGGSVSGSDGNITACSATGGVCSANYPATPGNVDLTATPSPGHLFRDWSGDCSGTSPTVSLTTNSSRSCTATFGALALVVNRSTSPGVGDPARCLVGNANTCGLSDAVAAAVGGDTITFAAHVTSVFPEAAVVFADMSGNTITVDGGAGVNLAGGAHRLLQTQAGARTVLRGVRAVASSSFHGDGAALYNEGITILDHCTASLTRTLPVAASADGGAIYNAATGDLTLNACTVSGNTASDRGGGIRNLGSLSVVASTLSGNRTMNELGGGGNLHNEGTAELVNSTIANGTSPADGAGIHNTGTLTLTNVTVAGNTGTSSSRGIYNTGHLTLRNALVHDCVLASGTLVDGGGNLDSGSGCGLNAATSHSNAFLNLGALGNNGGATLTLLPGPGSVVFDAGIDSVCNDPAGVAGIDQRGSPRPLGVHCDAGAVESPEPPPVHLGGTATGHNGDVVLHLTTSNPSGAQQATVAASDTTFDFAVIHGSNWQLDIDAFPAGQTCTLVPSSGTALVADLDTLALTCTTNPPLEVSVTHSDTSCHGGANGLATATANGGTPPYGYQWSPSGGSSSMASGLSAGDYTITVTDSLGESLSLPVSIASPPPILLADTTLADGLYGSPYAATIAASGGVGPISLDVVSGTLPQGMTLDASGELSGPPAPAGTYDFSIRALDGNSCEQQQPFTLVIAPAPLTVTADDATRDFGVANPSFGASYSGFVNGDTEAVLSPALSFTTDALADSPPGTYAIVPVGTVGANYSPVFVDGTLTVTDIDGRVSLAIARILAGDGLATYEVEVLSHLDAAIDSASLDVRAPQLAATQWLCLSDVGACTPESGGGTARTAFVLGAAARAVVELAGEPQASATFVEVTAELQIPAVGGMSGRHRAVLVDPVSPAAVFASGFE